MLKRTLIIAAGAVLVLTGLGEAQDLQYRVYGLAHVSTDLQNNGDDASVFVSSNTTRVGIKGRHKTDLEAFDVVFQYESNANFNGEGNNTFSTRNSFAGLQGDWGRLIWGRHDTPLFSLRSSVDFFGARIGELRNVTKYFGSGWDERAPAMIMYNSPPLGEAFKVNLQYVADEGVQDSPFLSSSAVYDRNGLMIGLGFETHGSVMEEGDVASTGLRAVASYRAEALRIAGLYQTLSNVGGVDGVAATTFGLGASYRLDGALEPKVQYYVMDPDTDVDDDGAAMLTVGLDYHLDKKSRLYVTYAMMMNEDAAEFVPFRGGHGKNYGYGADAPGEDPYGVSVGLITVW